MASAIFGGNVDPVIKHVNCYRSVGRFVISIVSLRTPRKIESEVRDKKAEPSKEAR